jgi:hypothetical protein
VRACGILAATWIDDLADSPDPRPTGLATVAAALADWDDLEAAVEWIYAARRRARDRPPPEFD